jgi:hypothetical protein
MQNHAEPYFAEKDEQEKQQEKNLMKYLSPVKHLYRVAYADPTEHIKRVQNLHIKPAEQGFAIAKEEDQKRELVGKRKKSQRIF